MRYTRYIALAGICLAMISTAGWPAASAAQADAVLARDYPEAAVFLQMARRGAVDFAARHGRLPQGLPEIQDGGYSAYLFPTNWRPRFEVRDAMLEIGNYGRPVYLGGQHVKAYDVRVTPPAAGLYHDLATGIPQAAGGGRHPCRARPACGISPGRSGWPKAMAGAMLTLRWPASGFSFI